MKLNLNIFSYMSVVNIMASLLCIYSGFFFCMNDKSLFIEWEIFFFSGASGVMSVIFDWMSLFFLGVVFLISGSISKFSEYYMMDDKDYERFMFSLMFFVLSMVFLIISPNIMSILLGWDGLGLTSYVLVIYYQNEKSCNAGMLTVLSNRIGDVCILMSIGLVVLMGDWNFIFFNNSGFNFLILFFVVLAGMTKSAQIPFSAWLPAAMAAPTPVSALVHSSTLVTAGVYLVIRFSPLLKDSKMLDFLLFVSVITMFMSGWGANFETDMKKIIALSTLSQLGVMMMILSLGLKELAFFHLISHAMFKSTLFMCAGVIIHMSNGSQDSRFMSSISSSSPNLVMVFSLTNMALLGFPFLAGFYSKDMVLEGAFMNMYNFMLVMIVVVSTGMTVSYSVRVMFLGMSSVNNLKSVSELMDKDKILMKSMTLLLVLSMVIGFIFSWVCMWVSNIFVLSSISKFYTLAVSLMMGGVMYLCFMKLKFKAYKDMKKVLSMGLSLMWFLPFLSTKNMSKSAINMGGLATSLFDKGWLEYYGGEGGQKYLMKNSGMIQKSQETLMIKSYLLSFVILIMFYTLIF